MENGGLPLVPSALHPDGVVVAVDVNDVKVGDGRVALTFPALRLELLQVAPLGKGVDGEDFVRVELVAFAADATSQPRLVHHFAHRRQEIVLGQHLRQGELGIRVRLLIGSNVRRSYLHIAVKDIARLDARRWGKKV